MGLGGIGIWQLLIVLVIVLLLFGTKRLRNLGSDLGSTIKGFRKAMDTQEKDEDKDKDEDEDKPQLSEKSDETSAQKQKSSAEQKEKQD